MRILEYVGVSLDEPVGGPMVKQTALDRFQAKVRPNATKGNNDELPPPDKIREHGLEGCIDLALCVVVTTDEERLGIDCDLHVVYRLGGNVSREDLA